MKQALRGDADDDWHEWRKRVKDLWYAGRIIAPITGPQIEGLVEEADELSDVLGDHNDLAVLLEAAGDRPGLRAAIVARRDGLRRVAATLGRRLYGERPKAFARRLEALLAAHEDAHAASARWLTPQRRRRHASSWRRSRPPTRRAGGASRRDSGSSGCGRRTTSRTCRGGSAASRPRTSSCWWRAGSCAWASRPIPRRSAASRAAQRPSPYSRRKPSLTVTWK